MFFETTGVRIGAIELNNSDHLGQVSVGSNYLVNQNVAAKKTQGFGQQHADMTRRYDMIHLVLDDDVIDGVAEKTGRAQYGDGGGC